MKKISIICFIIFSCLTVVHAQKVAVVDMEYVLDKMPEHREAQKKLDALATQWQDEINLKVKEIDDMYRAFQNEQVLLTDQLKKQKIKEIETRERGIKELQRAKFGPEGELFKKREELLKPIQDRIYNAIQDLAKAKSYDLILDKSSQAGILFSSQRSDRSREILDALGY